MLIEDVNTVGLQTPQRGVSDIADVRRSAVEGDLLAAVEFEPELRRDDHLIANGSEPFAYFLYYPSRRPQPAALSALIDILRLKPDHRK